VSCKFRESGGNAEKAHAGKCPRLELMPAYRLRGECRGRAQLAPPSGLLGTMTRYPSCLLVFTKKSCSTFNFKNIIKGWLNSRSKGVQNISTEEITDSPQQKRIHAEPQIRINNLDLPPIDALFPLSWCISRLFDGEFIPLHMPFRCPSSTCSIFT
jgi:hypothetical protein